VNHDIIDNLNKIPGVHIHDIDIPLKKWTGNPGVDPTLVHQWCISLAPTCKKFDGAFKILAYLVRLGAHNGVCKMVRVTFPIEDTYHTNVMPTVFGWLYYGGADPFPHTPNENCIGREPTPNSGIDGGVQKSLDYTCIILGAPPSSCAVPPPPFVRVPSGRTGLSDHTPHAQVCATCFCSSTLGWC